MQASGSYVRCLLRYVVSLMRCQLLLFGLSLEGAECFCSTRRPLLSTLKLML